MCKRELILLLIIYIPNSLCIIEDIYHAAIAVTKLYSHLNETGPNTYYYIRNVYGACRFNNEKNSFVNNQLDNIHQRLHSMEASLNRESISETFKSWPISILIARCLDTIELHISEIDNLYDEFHQHRIETEHCGDSKLREFMEKANSDIEAEILFMRKIVIDKSALLPNHSNLLDAISSNGVMLQDEICNGPEIIAASLVRLLKMVLLAEIKASVVLAFVTMYMYRQSTDWKMLNSVTNEVFKERFGVYVNEFKKTIDIVDQLYLRTCDPVDSIWVRNENFYELVGTFQTTIFRYHWGICHYGSCDAIVRIRNRCEAEKYSLRSACSDKITSCSYLGAIKACVLEGGPYKLQYLNSTALGSFGRNFECPKNKAEVIDDGTGADMVFAACGCNCHSNRNKISLVLIQSDVASNRVITALRFLRQHQILYIQARTGRLNAHGYIQQSSERWIPLPKNIPSTHIHSINRTNGVFFLDDLRLPAHHVLTGIKFNKVTRENGTGFAIEIFGVPFDYGRGKLFSESKFMISVKASNEYLGKELLVERVNSIYSTLRHTASPGSSNYILLKRSTLKDDVGQSTLPLFDAVLVKPNPLSVLGGVGLFHKGAEGYAGLISLRLFPIDYKKFFEEFQSFYMKNEKLSFVSSNDTNSPKS